MGQNDLHLNEVFIEYNERLLDIHSKMWRNQLSSISDTRLYLAIKDILACEKYLTCIEPKHLGSHMFQITTRSKPLSC